MAKLEEKGETSLDCFNLVSPRAESSFGSSRRLVVLGVDLAAILYVKLFLSCLDGDSRAESSKRPTPHEEVDES